MEVLGIAGHVLSEICVDLVDPIVFEHFLLDSLLLVVPLGPDSC